MIRFVISLILILTIGSGISAQRITRRYDDISFSEALKDLNARQNKYVINFVYDELEDFKVTKSIKNKNVPDAIMDLIGFYPIRMKQMDNVIIVECSQKTSNKMIGRVVDINRQPVDFANIILLNVNDSSFITGGVTNEISGSTTILVEQYFPWKIRGKGTGVGTGFTYSFDDDNAFGMSYNLQYYGSVKESISDTWQRIYENGKQVAFVDESSEFSSMYSPDHDFNIFYLDGLAISRHRHRVLALYEFQT